MMAVLRSNDITHWRESYLRDLQALPQDGRVKSQQSNVTSLPKLA